ncbi:MAG TPA: universal stress protein [Candidatus Caenarcaniphilales bacterium]
MFKTVLFPIDQSRDSQEAAETVAEVVKFCGSRLILLSVQETEAESEQNPPSTTAINQLLDTAKATFAQWGIESETLHRVGKPAFTICDVADEMNASLIVMGCRGIGLTQEGAAESVSTRVINLSPCPVLIVP